MSQRPRVLYLCGWPIGARGEGAVSFVYEQIEALSEHVDAIFVEPRFCSIAEWVWRRARGEIVSPISDLWPSGVMALRVWTRRWPTRLTRRTLLEDIRLSGRDIIEQLPDHVGKMDLIHAHVVLPAGLFGVALGEAMGVPLILQEHSGPFEMHLDTEEKRRAVGHVLARADAVTAVGEQLRERISALVDRPEKITVIPNLVRTDLFTARPRPLDARHIRLVTVASLHPVKGLDDLLDAIVVLRRSGCDARLDIIGDGPLREDLAGRIAQLGLKANVALRGVLPRAAVAEVVAGADIYVCSSHTETFGLAPVEALSVGRPVVTTSCGGPEEYVHSSCGAVVPVRDPRALADGIRAVWARLKDFEPATMHERVDELFGGEAFTGRVIRLYHGVLGENRRALQGLRCSSASAATPVNR